MAEAPRQFTNFNRAWRDYLADDLPFNTYLGGADAVQQIPDLLALRDQIDVFLLDGFGVLNRGFDAVPGMSMQITRLQQQGVHCIVLSNGATQTVEPMVQKYASLGFDFRAENVLTSRDALREGLRQHRVEHSNFVWGVTPTAAAEHPDLPASIQQLDSAEDFEQVDGFLMLSTLRWSARHDWLLRNNLRKRARPVWVGNPDVCAPFPAYFSREPGQVTRNLTRNLGVEVEYFGKPHANVYTVAMNRVRQLVPNIDKSRIAMVGDSPHTDILGARMAGLKSVLMQDHGLLVGQPLSKRLTEAGIWPDFLIAKDRFVAAE